jgi:hypothetical protein
MHAKFSKVVATIALLVSLACLTPPAHADPVLRLRLERLGMGAGGIVVTDDAMGDLDSSPGIVQVSDLLNGFGVNFVTGFSSPPFPLGPGAVGAIHLDPIHIKTSPGAGTLLVTLVGTGYTTVSNLLTLLGSVGGLLTAPAGSTVTVQSWVNPNNLVPDLGPDQASFAALAAIGALPAGSIPVFGSSGATFGPGVIAGQAFVPFVQTGTQFSLFAQATITFTGPGVTTFDEEQQVIVPEPTSFVLGALGAVGLASAAWLRRRRRIL